MLKKIIQWDGLPHAIVLGICLGLIILSFMLKPAVGDGNPASSDHSLTGKLQLGSFVLPASCTMKSTTGVPCPGCGLTHSWVSLVHRDIKTSLSHHRVGWLVFIYTCLQVIRHIGWFLAPGIRTFVNVFGKKLDYGIIGIMLMLVVNWILKLF